MFGKRKSVSATVGAIFVIVLLIAVLSTILLYNQFFTSSSSQVVKQGEVENAKDKESLKVIPQNSPKILVQNAWGRDSIIRYILTLDVNDIVQSSTEVNITVPADSSVIIDLQAHGVPIGSKYMFVTALGNNFGPVSFTYVLIVYVYRDGTSTGAQGVIVQVDDAQYSTDANGMVSTIVPYGEHTIGIVQSSPATGVQYVFTKWSDGSTTNPRVFQISQPTVLTAYAKVQYLLTMNVNPSNGGTVSPGTGWYDAGATVQISATPNTGFRFGSWSGSGSGSYTGTSNPASVTMNGPITETANFIQVATVTFSASGLSSDASGTILVVDSVGYSFSQLPLSFVWDVGSSHTFSWASPVSAGSGKQYVWTSTSGLSTSQSGTIVVPSGGGNVVASYKTQYTVTLQTSGLPSDFSGNSVTFDNSGYRVYDGSPVTLWVDSGRTVGYSWSTPISSNTNGKRYVITSSQSGSITVDGPKTVSATYKTQYYLTVNSAYDSPNPTSNWFDAGSSVTASVTSPVSGGSGIQYVCTGWSGTGSVPASGVSTSVTFVLNAPSSITWNWKTQYYLTMQVNPSAGGTVTPSSGWYDSGTQVQISATPASGYRFDSWSGSGTRSYSGTSASATVTMNAPITETANFVQIATVSFSATGIGSDASGTVLTVDGLSYSYSQLPLSFVWDVGSSHSFSWSSPVSAGSGKQYVWVSTSGLSTAQSGSITVSSGGGSVSATYKTQYYLTMQVSPSGAGTVNPSSGWFDAGASVQISATPSSGYRFDHWTGSGTGSYSGSNNPASVTVNGPITETAYFVQIATITFSASGLGSDASGTILTVDGVQYYYSQLPVSFTWDVGSSHSFTWSDPVSTSASDKRYVWVSTSGLSTSKSGSVTVPSGGGSVSASYKTQYLWTFSASGLGSDASGTVATIDGTGYSYSSLPASFWWDSGSSHSYSYQGYVGSTTSGKRYAINTPTSATVTVSSSGNVAPSYRIQYLLTTSVSPSGGGSVSASPSSSDGYYDSGTAVTLTASANSGYAFDAWTGDASGTSTSTSVTMSSPKSVTANFFTFSISVNPTSGSVVQGGSVSATVTVSYGGGVNSKTISFSASGLPSGASASFSPSSVTVSPSSSTASSTMTISTSTSTPTGTYTITITGSGGGVSKTTQYSLTVTLLTYAVNFYVYDDAGNAVSGATINFGGSSYSHGGSASVPPASYSLSTGTIPGGYRFKQWETSGGVSVSSSTSSSTTATVGGSGSITMRLQRLATVTFSVSGLGSDASGTILTVDGNSYSYSQLPVSFTWDVGSSHSFSWNSPISAGSGKQYVWASTSGLSTSQSGSISVPSGGGSVSASYKTQYYLTVNSAYDSPTPSSGWFDAGSSVTASVTSPVSGGSGIQYVCTGWSGSGSVPSSGSSSSVTFTINAPSSITWNWKTQYYLTMQVGGGSGTVTPSSGWYDSGSSVQISASPSSNYRFDHWTGSGTGSYSGTSNPAAVTMNGPITETAYFAQTGSVTFSVSGIGSDASGTLLTVDGVSYSYSQLPLTFVWDVGSSHNFAWSSPVSAGSGKQYAWVSTSGLSTSQSGTITVPSGGGSVSASYKTQYYLTMQVGGGSGSVSPSSGWFDSGAQVQISATPSANYRFDHWTGSGSGSYSGSNNPATITMNGPITESAYFVQTATVTFSASGLSSDASGTILTVDGVSYSYSQLPKSFTWDVGSSHSFSWSSPVSAGSGKQYVWTSCSGLSTSQSGSITVPSGGGSITASYKTQYYLTMQVGGGSGSVSPSSGWYDAGASVSISATASSGYAFDQWIGSGSGSYTGTSASASVTMNAPITETAYFFTFSISISPNSGSVVAGGSVSATVTVSYGSGYNSKSISFSASGLPSGASASFNPSSVTISPSSTSASSTITISTSSSTSSGTFSITVTGSGGGVSKQTTYSLSVYYSVSLYIYDDAGNTVSSASLNFAGSSYSSGASVNVFSGSYSLSTGTIPSGYRFKQWEVSGGVSVSSSTSSSTTATVSGSGTIIMRLQRLATVTFSTSGLSSDASGTILTVDGVSYSYSSLPVSFTWDVGSSHSFSWSSPVSAGSGKQYVWTSTSGISTSQSGSVTVPAGGGSVSASYKTQYYLTVNSAYDSPNPSSGWFDAGSSITASISSPVSGGSGIQYVCTGWSGSGSVPSSGSGTSTTFTINAPSSITWNWKTQYYLTMQVGSGSGTVSPSSGWYDSGVQVQISASPSSGYRFGSWSGSGSGSYSGTNNPATVTMNGPITETANFIQITTVTFSVSGMSSDASGTVLTVDGVSYSYSNLPVSFTWDVGSSHSFSWSSPVSAGSGKQYAWVSTSGLSTSQSGSITVPSNGGSVTASYKTQYYLTVNSAYDSPTPTSGWFDAGTSITASVTSPTSGGTGIQYVCTGWSGSGSVPSSGSGTSTTFTINAPSSITWNWKTQYYLTMQANPSAGGTVTPSSGWYDSGAQVQISASPSFNYRFDGWTGSGSGSYTGYSNPASITMNAPITETASFDSWLTGWQYRKRHVINPASGAGTNYPVHITVYYGSGTDNGENVYLNGKCKSDFTDIRFTKSDGSTLLSYWMESVSSGNYATFWVQVSDDLSTNPATIYIYYSNPSASRADDPQDIDLWQLREHQTVSGYYPNFIFTKTDSTTIRIDSYTGGSGSLGEGDIFIIVPRDWLNGKKVQINWNGYFSTALARKIANVVVLDTELNRKQSLAINWVDSIYTSTELVSYTSSSSSSGWTGWQTTTSGTISISSFSNKYVTLMIRCADAWTGQTVMLDVNWIKILDANNNVIKTYDFTNSVVMEVTGTYEDYGLYRKYVSPEPSHDGWGSEEAYVVGWLSGWSYRNYHIINGVSTQLTDYQVRITVYYGSGTSSGDTVYLNGLCKSDFSDLRFTGPDGVTLLPYWIESYTASSVAYVWVKIPSIPASGSTTFYLYYGNPSASSASDGASTFLFFDDFLGTSLDTSKWDVRTTSGGTYSVSGGILTITVQSDGVNWKEVTLRSYTTLPSKCEIRAKVKWTYASEHEPWIMNYYTDPSNLQAMGYRGYIGAYVLRTVISGTAYDRTYSLSNNNPSSYEWWALSYDGTTLAFKRTTVVSGSWMTLQSATSNIITSGYTVGIRDAVKGSTASYFYIDYIFARNLNNPEPSHGAWG